MSEDYDGLEGATTAESITTVVEERAHHLRARRARALGERRRLDRAREAPPLPWTPAETGRLRALVKELGSKTDARGFVKRSPQVPVAVLAAQEAVVMDTSLPQFQRGYAWLKCLGFWAGLRSDDGANIDPKSVAKGTCGGLSLIHT